MPDSTYVIAAAAERATSSDRLEANLVALFEQLRSPMLRYLLTLGLTAHDGEEIVQEVFLLLFRHLRLGKNRDNLRGWVFRVAHNLALKRRSRSRREFPYSAESRETVDPELNPEEQMAGSQRQQRLLAVMRVLPEQDRHCLYLRAEGLRYREIAEVLGISLGTVSNLLGRSLERLGRADEL